VELFTEGGKKTRLLQWNPKGNFKEGQLRAIKNLKGAPRTFLVVSDVIGDGLLVSSPIKVKKSTNYKLAFKIRIAGFAIDVKKPETDEEKFIAEFLVKCPFYWIYGIDFLGLSIGFYDKRGDKIGNKDFPSESPSTMPWYEYQKYRDDYSHGWVESWIDFKTPKNTTSISISIRMASKKVKVKGGIALADFYLIEELQEVPTSKKMKKLIINVIDDKKGKPTPCQISVTSLDSGESFFPRFCIKYKYPFPFFFSFTGSAVLNLPEGTYQVEAIRGFRTEIARAMVFLLGEGERNITLKLYEPLDMAGRNWYCGDHHIHLFGHFSTIYPMLNFNSLVEMSRAVGLDYVPYSTPYLQYKKRNKREYKFSGDIIAEITMEMASYVWGHFCTLGVSKPVKDVPQVFYIYPTIYESLRQVIRNGGAIVGAHPAQILQIPHNTVYETKDLSCYTGDHRRWNLCKVLPLLLLSGIPCGYDLIIADGYGTQKMFTREYYKLLNFGFKISACGSTDCNVDISNSRNPLGSCRTYVYADTFSMKDIAKGYIKGHTFATNGPLILLKVKEHMPGDTLFVEKGEKINIDVHVFSAFGLSFAEIIFNGEPVFRKELTGHNELKFSFELKIEKHGWLAGIVRGPGNRWINSWPIPPEERRTLGQFAHTTPVYVRIQGERFKPSHELVNYYHRWLTNMKKLPEGWKELLIEDAKRSGITPEEAKRHIIRWIETGLKKIEKIASEGWEE